MMAFTNIDEESAQSVPLIVSTLPINTSSYTAVDKNDDDDDAKPTCQICYVEKSDDDDLFADLCQCRGSIGYVHVSCLRDWLQRQQQSIAGDDWQLMVSMFSRKPRCSVCNTPYNDRLIVGYKWRPIRLWRMQRHLVTVVLYVAVFILLTTFSLTAPKITIVHMCALLLYVISATIWWLGFTATNKDVVVSIV